MLDKTHLILFIITIMPKIVDHEERRRAIAAAAVDAIATNGLSGVKLTDIARSAGVTTGSIAHYFPDKDAVLAAALEEVCAHLFLQAEDLKRPLRFEDFAALLPTNETNRKEWKVWLAYWGRAPHAPVLAQIHRDYYAEIESGLAAQFQTTHADPTLAAAAIISALDGVGTRATLEPELWPTARQETLLASLIMPILDQHTQRKI